MKDVQSILVPTDFSECSREAMRYALMLARTTGAHLELLHVWALPIIAASGDVLATLPDQPVQRAAAWIEEEAARGMEQFLREFDCGSCCVATRIESGRPDEAIVAIAKEDRFDLIVMGTHGRSGLSHLVMGSVAERVVRRAECPVMTVKAAA